MKPASLFLLTCLLIAGPAIASPTIPAPLAAVLKLDGIAPRHDGPNCWNVSLVASGTLPALRHTRAEEFSYYLDSPYCRQLLANEITAGDLGVVRELKHGSLHEIHAYVHVSADLVFSKNGTGSDSRYLLQPQQEMERIYGGPEREFSFYRCGPVEGSALDPELGNVLEEVAAFEAELEKLVLLGTALSYPSRSNLLGLMDRISSLQKISPDSRVGFEMLKLRFSGIEEQLHLAGEHFLAVEVADRRRRLGI